MTISLAGTGAQDTIPDLLRIARTDKEGAIRGEAMRMLNGMLIPPKPTDVPPRLRPGEMWQPLSDQTRSAIINVLIASLADTSEFYHGPNRENSEVIYYIQDSAKGYLEKLGYTVQPTTEGWSVLSPDGQLVANIPAKAKGQYPKKQLNGIE